jgi:hypothetical protein
MSKEIENVYTEGPSHRNDYNYRPRERGPQFIRNDWSDAARKASGGLDIMKQWGPGQPVKREFSAQ